MTNETDVVSTTETQPELKSKDTGIFTKESKPYQETETAATEDNADPSSGDDDAKPADEQKKKSDRLPRWVQERLIREREKTARETEERLRNELKPQETAKPKPEKSGKTLEDFDYDQDAYLEYRLDQKLTERESRREQEVAERKRQESEEAFKKRIDAFEEEAGAGAWEDIESSALNVDPRYKGLAGLIQDEEDGLKLAHHLALNPDEAERIVKLRPLAMAQELAKLSDKLKPANLPRKTTNAPPPPKTVSGAGKPSLTVDSPNISSAERIRLWQEERRHRR